MAKPEFDVFARSFTPDSSGKKHWKRVGVGWQSKSRVGVPYIKVKLDFIPNDGELAIYPVDETNKTRTRFDAIAEELD